MRGDEFSCKQQCTLHDQCTVYTFYISQDSVSPNICVLLNTNGLQNPVSGCDHCATRPANCTTGQRCQVSVFKADDPKEIIMSPFLIAERSMNLSFLAREKDCYAYMTTVAVGGEGCWGVWRRREWVYRNRKCYHKDQQHSELDYWKLLRNNFGGAG